MKVSFILTTSLIGLSATNGLSQSFESSENAGVTTIIHNHSKSKRAVALEVVYETVIVDKSGQAISTAKSTSTAPTSILTFSETSSSEKTSSVVPTTSSHSSSTPVTSSEQYSSSSSSSSSSSLPLQTDILPLYSPPTEKFQDGVIPCSSFPGGQGVVSLDWLGFGGWSGIENDDGSTGGTCREGSYCSYACQPGMSKTQWPSSQPANGVSVGGLLCQNGKLHRSNFNSEYLCEWGVDKAVVESQLQDVVSICRTDYPGTENMVIPTIVEAGERQPLTTVDQESYYVWQGKKTSAQYYVNNAGVTKENGCIWGTSGSGVGNWAPLNFGAGYTNGIAYLSLIPNPNNRDPANFRVKIIADGSGSQVSGECSYAYGVYNGDQKDGCTVAVTSGRAKYVLY